MITYYRSFVDFDVCDDTEKTFFFLSEYPIRFPMKELSTHFINPRLQRFTFPTFTVRKIRCGHEFDGHIIIENALNENYIDQ